MQRVLIILISLIIPLTTFSQNLKKGFKNLEDGNLSEARVIFNQTVDDQSTKSAAYFGLAKIEAIKKRTGYDLFKAYDYIFRADKFVKAMDPKVVSKISKYYSAAKVKAEKTRIDDLLSADVIKKKEMTLVDRFLKECENSEHYLEVLDLKASLEYEQVLTYDTEKDYLDFISRYPEAKEVDDAKIRINGLAWSKAEKENSIDSYSLFINDYPEAPQVDSAKAHLIDMEYQKAILLNTDEAFTKFINKYAGTDQARDMAVKREKLAYDKAKSFGAFIVYQSFIDEFPQSGYIPEIITYRDSLAFVEAKRLNTDKSYVDFVNTYPNAKQVPLAMQLLSSMSFSVAELAYMQKISYIKNQHIKSYKAFRINVKDSAQILIEELVMYDTLGHELSFMTQPDEGMKTLIENTFDKEGKNRLSQKVFVNEKEQKKITFTYFNEGLIKTKSVICYFDCGKYPAEYISTYQYDTLRNIVSITDSAIMDSSIIARHSLQYNAQGLLTLEDVDYADTTNISTTYKYDGNNKLMEKSISNQDGKVLEVVSYTYDQKGRKISMKRFNAAGVVDHKYTYGEQGRIDIEDIEVKSNGESFRLSYQYEFYK